MKNSTFYSWLITCSFVLWLLDAWFQGRAGETGAFLQLVTLRGMSITTFGPISFPLPGLSWLSSLFSVLSWNYSYFNNDFGWWARLFLVGAVYGRLFWPLIVQVAPVIIGGVQAAAAFIANLGSLLNPVRFIR